jgi:hypothetical protein
MAISYFRNHIALPGVDGAAGLARSGEKLSNPWINHFSSNSAAPQNLELAELFCQF